MPPLGPLLRLSPRQRLRPAALGLLAAALAAAPLAGQAALDSASRRPVLNRPEFPVWLVQGTSYYNAVDNGFGAWYGQDVRIQRTTRYTAAFVTAGTQTRPQGSQQVLAVGTILSILPRLSASASVSLAPDYGTVLFPRRRRDVGLMYTVPWIDGLLWNTVLTDVGYTDRRIGGTIFSGGPLYYRGLGIYTAQAFVNRDRASGALSGAFQVSAQRGLQGRYWIGGGFGGGNEAYRLLLDVPFDARFSSRSANVFATRWFTRNLGGTARMDLEEKRSVYRRLALSLSVFTEF